MAQLPRGALQFLENAEQWVIDHQVVVGALIALIAALKIESIFGFFTERRQSAPRIEFELERVDPISGHENLTFVVKVVNVEGRVA
jgi:hypothetical protein